MSAPLPPYPPNDALPLLAWAESSEPSGMRQALDYWRITANAALARLRLIAERDYLWHDDACPATRRGGDCSCGLDELLATLLPPQERGMNDERHNNLHSMQYRTDCRL